jgi:hypothetical protein
MTSHSLQSVDIQDSPFRLSIASSVTAIVGGPDIMLHQQYDPAQLWLGFTRGVVLCNQSRGNKADLWTVENMTTSDRYELGLVDHMRIYRGEYTTLAPAELGVPQMVLPFHEYRRVRGLDLVALSMADFSNFGRDENGNLWEFPVNPADLDAVVEWCHENCIGRYAYFQGHVYLDREEDAVAVRLMV